MADQGAPGDRPSLAMPSLPFGRKKERPEVPVETDATLEPDPVAGPGRSAGHDRPRRPQLPGVPDRPGLTGVAAAVATGAVVGALGALLVWLASLGCEAARGTASCGDGPGFLVLVAILVTLALLGGVLLRAFGVADAGSTSLLAVGVLAVLVLVLLTDSLFEWRVGLAVPVVSALAYALSWWVSTRVVRPEGDEPPHRL